MKIKITIGTEATAPRKNPFVLKFGVGSHGSRGGKSTVPANTAAKTAREAVMPLRKYTPAAKINAISNIRIGMIFILKNA